MPLTLLKRFSAFLLGEDEDITLKANVISGNFGEKRSWFPERGGLVEIVGPNAAGKSFVLHLLLAQITNKFAQPLAYIDCDGTFQLEVAQALRADSNHFAVLRPKTLGQSLRMLDILNQQGVPNILLDSYTQLSMWASAQKTDKFEEQFLYLLKRLEQKGAALYLTHQQQHGDVHISPYRYARINIKKPLNPSVHKTKTFQQALDSGALEIDLHS
jgi:hypothetical protein